jgi:hypothetical protein
VNLFLGSLFIEQFVNVAIPGDRLLSSVQYDWKFSVGIDEYFNLVPFAIKFDSTMDRDYVSLLHWNNASSSEKQI